MKKLVVVGGGIFGLASALEAARRGRRVVLLERGRIPAPDAASTSPSRKLKSTYRDPAYSRLGASAMAAWADLEREAGAELVVRLGNLVVSPDAADPRLEEQARNSEAAGGTIERLDDRALTRRFPQFHAARSAIFEPAAGFIRATEAVRALRRLVEAAGVAIVEGAAVDAWRQLDADQILVAAGGWSAGLLPQLRELITLRRAGVAYVSGLSAAFEAGVLPPFSIIGTNAYGFPRWRGERAKFGWHDGAEATEDAEVDRTTATPAFQAGIARLLLDQFGVDAASLDIEWASCLYDVSPASDFLIDAVPGAPGVFVACGSSGHGFKFGSIIGRIVLDRLDDRTGADGSWLPQFGWSAALEARDREALSTPI